MNLELLPHLKMLEPTESDSMAFVRVQINGWNSTLEWIEETLALKP